MCTPMVDSCWCMAKPIQYCKVKKKKKSVTLSCNTDGAITWSVWDLRAITRSVQDPRAVTCRGGFNVHHSKSLLWRDKNRGAYAHLTLLKVVPCPSLLVSVGSVYVCTHAHSYQHNEEHPGDNVSTRMYFGRIGWRVTSHSSGIP